nr:C39 family peptidase [Herbaspirillum sp. C7C8]
MPRSYQLDYDQGGEVEGYWGTCGETSVANVTLMGGRAVSEKEVVQCAIKENLCDTAAESADMRGATSEDDRQALLEHFGFACTIDERVDLTAVAQSIKDGKGVIISVNASKLWDLHEENEDTSDHAITVTGVSNSLMPGLMGEKITLKTLPVRMLTKRSSMRRMKLSLANGGNRGYGEIAMLD